MSTDPGASTPLTTTPGQTVGPFFGYALPYDGGPDLVPPGHPGQVWLHGRVLDGAGNPVPDALLEIRQAAPDGSVPAVPGSLKRDGRTFTGWGRAETDRDGQYLFRTLRPGPVEPGQPAFFAVSVLARGLLDVLFTRAYLPQDEEAQGSDPFLSALTPERRATLVAAHEPVDPATGRPEGFRFDICLQGERETVFLAHRPH